jgi:hypothetical protein
LLRTFKFCHLENREAQEGVRRLADIQHQFWNDNFIMQVTDARTVLGIRCKR